MCEYEKYGNRIDEESRELKIVEEEGGRDEQGKGVSEKSERTYKERNWKREGGGREEGRRGLEKNGESQIVEKDGIKRQELENGMQGKL